MGTTTVGTQRHGPAGTWIAGTWITVALLGLLALLAGAPGTPVATVAAAQPGWVDVTDAPSGVTAALPGPAEPATVPYGRAYAPDGADVAFAVLDVPVPPGLALAGVVDTVAPGLGVTVVESRDTTVDGRQALDAVIDVDRDGVSGTALVRAVVDDGHVIVLATRARDGADPAARQLHEQLLTGVRFS